MQLFKDEINLIENKIHTFLLDTNDVAIGYGVNPNNIRANKKNNQDDFIEGKHFIFELNSKKQKKMLWTKKGVVRLGFFIKSENAKKFRDWAEDYIVNEKSSNSDLQKILNQIEKQNQEIQNLKNQLALQEPQKPINPFRGFYENRNRDLGQRENEFAYSRNDWMMLLNECETQLGLERGRKTKTLLISGGGR